jgi:hypothetical protein
MSALTAERRPLPRLVTCGCGHALWSEDIEELIQLADEHVMCAHPELVGTLSPLELARPALKERPQLAA